MIHRRKSSMFLFVALQAMAVAIICLGSLINFHQYKIWGKPLIPNFVGYKRDIEKYSKTLSFSKLSGDKQNFLKDNNSKDFIYPDEFHSQVCCSGICLSCDLYQDHPATSRVSSCGLRGPPIS
ncbi:MAG: hypothetical protein WCJ26_05405 [bacterium]